MTQSWLLTVYLKQTQIEKLTQNMLIDCYNFGRLKRIVYLLLNTLIAGSAMGLVKPNCLLMMKMILNQMIVLTDLGL